MSQAGRLASRSAGDPTSRARELAQLHDATFSGDDVSAQLRPVVRQSWRRSLDASVDPDRHAPPTALPDGELRERREAHPLAAMLPMLRETLLDRADEALHVMIITDAAGNILWREGSSRVERDADSVLLTEGTRWSETSIGTNAMGTALATATPVQIHSAEHLVRTYHSWTCAASPVHDPDTGALLGTLDISGPLHTMHPALLTLVSTSARLVESQLRLRVNARDDELRHRHAHRLDQLRGARGALLSSSGRVLSCEPATWLAQGQRVDLGADASTALVDGEDVELEPLDEGYLLLPRQHRPTQSRVGKGTAGTGANSGAATGAENRAATATLSLSLLGDGVPTAAVDDEPLELTLRHAEILALLVLHPAGLTAEQLALLLHGERGNPTSTRVEIHRLRNHVGHQVVRTKPYRITAETTSDFAVVREAARRGDLDAAVRAYRGALLPRSESPEIRQEREDLLATYRSSLLNAGRPEPLWQFALDEDGREDVEVLNALRAALPGDDPRRGAVEARLRRLPDDEV